MRKLGVSVLIIRTHFSNINDRHQDINLCKFLDTIMQHMNAPPPPPPHKKRLSMSKNVHFIVCFLYKGHPFSRTAQRNVVAQNVYNRSPARTLQEGLERCCEGSCPKNDHQQDGILAPNSWWSTFLPRTLSRSLAVSGPSRMMLLSSSRSPLHWESSPQDDCGRLLQFLLAALEFGV